MRSNVTSWTVRSLDDDHSATGRDSPESLGGRYLLAASRGFRRRFFDVGKHEALLVQHGHLMALDMEEVARHASALPDRSQQTPYPREGWTIYSALAHAGANRPYVSVPSCVQPPPLVKIANRATRKQTALRLSVTFASPKSTSDQS